MKISYAHTKIKQKRRAVRGEEGGLASGGGGAGQTSHENKEYVLQKNVLPMFGWHGESLFAGAPRHQDF